MLRMGEKEAYIEIRLSALNPWNFVELNNANGEIVLDTATVTREQEVRMAIGFGHRLVSRQLRRICSPVRTADLPRLAVFQGVLSDISKQ